MSIDYVNLGSASSITNDYNVINEQQIEHAAPIHSVVAPNIADYFFAGTIDGSKSGIAALEGCGMTQAGFFSVGVNASDVHKLTFMLGASNYDYTESPAFNELGRIKAGELRIGDDVSQTYDDSQNYDYLNGSS